MNWIRPTTRLSIYLRDGLACAYCGYAVEDGAQLTLDHCIPRSKGGDNGTYNLVTACFKCNSSRQDRPMRSFAYTVAEYLGDGTTGKDIMGHVMRCRRRSIDAHRTEAANLLKRRPKSGTKIMSALGL